jgi:hypothetical protein
LTSAFCSALCGVFAYQHVEGSAAVGAAAAPSADISSGERAVPTFNGRQ